MTEDLTKIKEYFIKEYRSNGGTEDLTELTYELLLEKVKHQKEVHQLKLALEKANSTPPAQKTQFNTFKQGIDQGRYNADLAKEFAAMYGSYQNYIDPPFDMKQLDDDSFKRDNAMNVMDKAVVLRDNDGRCDAGGPSKYKGGFPAW